ncbi:transposase [Micromonospora sp. M71_S20]|uniref:transposase n=1 Tax=Micromonospora sp. M71_S20 TaxID=592872 RepID=UPI00351381EE
MLKRVAWDDGATTEVQAQGLGLIESGRSVTDVVRDLGISGQSIYTWRRQDRIERGLVPGLSSAKKRN